MGEQPVTADLGQRVLCGKQAAAVIFLPVRLGAWALDLVTRAVGVELPATDTLMLLSGVVFPPMHWSLHHLAKHYVTETILHRIPK